MNRDPLGLGRLLYGYRPTPAGPGTLLAAGAHFMTLIPNGHGDCGISTFCKNPLHPGPCKGWKKHLGKHAPGALNAIEKAHKEKVAAKRAARNEAKSAASKALTGRQLASPLHAKKATIKRANIILGDDEAKASKKADRVILNKTEIKKYSKIKAAQMNAMRAKHGLEEDTGLEDRIAEALAKDNIAGKDDNYRSVIAVSGDSLGAQLAQKHCKKGDGDCDGKPYEELRDELSSAAAVALATGDDEQLDKALGDYDKGAFKPAKIAADKKAAEDKAAQDKITAKAEKAAADEKAAAEAKAAKEQASVDKKAADKAKAIEALPAGATLYEGEGVGLVAKSKAGKWMSWKGNSWSLLGPSSSALMKEKVKKGELTPAGGAPAAEVAEKKLPKGKATPPPLEGTAAQAAKGKDFGLGLMAMAKGNKTLGTKAAQKDFADKLEKALGNGDENGVIKAGSEVIASTLIKQAGNGNMAQPSLGLSSNEETKLKELLEPEIVDGLTGGDAPKPVVATFEKAIKAKYGKDWPAMAEAKKEMADHIKVAAAKKIGVDPNASTNVVAAHILFEPGKNLADGHAKARVQVLSELTAEEFAGLPEGHKKVIGEWLQGRAEHFDEMGGHQGKADMLQSISLQKKLGFPPYNPKTPGYGAPEPAGLPSPKEAFGPDGDVDHPTAVAVVQAMTQEDWDGLTEAEKTSAMDNVSDALSMNEPGANEAMDKLVGFFPDAAGTPAPEADNGPSFLDQLVENVGNPNGVQGLLDAEEAKVANAPVNMSSWKKVGGQGGSNLGGMYEAPDGTRYYVKSLKSKEHAQNEVLAAKLYAAAGIDVPEVQHADGHPDGWKNVVASKIVPGASAKAKITKEGDFKAAAQDGYAVDAWLANYDAVGLTHDNIVDSDGKPVRIDVGGSLEYRAQGAKKSDWNNNPDIALKGLKDSSKNPQAASVFGGMTPEQEKKSAEHLLNVSDEQIDQMVKDAGMPDSMATTLKLRKKAILAKYGLDGPAPTAPPATLTPSAPPAPAVVTPAAAPTPTLPAMSPTTKAAVDYATGAKAGTMTKKFEAYAQLEEDEFAALPTDVQQLILADLKAAKAKFVNPAKKAQVQANLDVLTPLAGGGAGAGGPVDTTNPATKTTADKIHDGADWASKFVPLLDKPGDKKAGQKDEIYAATLGLLQSAHDSGTAPDIADGMASIWAQSALDKLDKMHSVGDISFFLPDEAAAMKPALAADIKKKFLGEPGPTPVLDAWTKAISLGILDDASAFIQAAHPGGGGDAGTFGAPPSPGDIAKVKMDADMLWYEAAGPGSGVKAIGAPATAELGNELAKAGSVGAFQEQQANKLATAVVKTVTAKAGVNMLGSDLNESLKVADAITAEFLQTMQQGKSIVPDGGVVEQLHKIGDEVKEAGDKLAAAQGWAPDSDALKNFKKALMASKMDEIAAKLAPITPAVSPAPTAPVSPAPLNAPNAPSVTPTAVGAGTDLADVPSDVQQDIFDQLKAMPSGKYLSHDKQETYGNLLALAAGHGQPGKPLSVLQVLKSIDAVGAKKAGVPNANKWETAFVDWLQTPEGSAFAAANPTADPALVKKITGDFGEYEGITTDLAELNKKVPLKGGPGLFDSAKPSSAFQFTTPTQAIAWRKKMLADQGGKYTDSQLSGIKTYTGSSYSAMNDWLRGETATISDHLRAQIQKTQDAMRPLPKDTLLIRGTGWEALPKGFRSAAGAKKLIGMDVMDEAFMSTSAGETPGYGSGKPLWMEIEAPAGTMAAYVDGSQDGQKISSNPGEREMLLAAGQSYRILGVEQKNGRTHVRVRIVTQ